MRHPHPLSKTDRQASGRPRDSLAVARRRPTVAAACFPAERFRVQMDDGDTFAASVTAPNGTGTSRKTVGADPATRFGEWLNP